MYDFDRVLFDFMLFLLMRTKLWYEFLELQRCYGFQFDVYGWCGVSEFNVLFVSASFPFFRVRVSCFLE